MEKNYETQINSMMPEYFKDLKKLISIKSHRDLSTASKGAPFGQGIKDAFDFIQERAIEMGFKVNNEDGYAIDVRTDDSDNYIGILCHIDTVQAIDIEKWHSDPYKLVERNGKIYGRGVNDNKGPLLGCLYILKLLKNQNKLSKPVRLIIGGAEETTWECMEYYFTKNAQPVMAFSPDGDFPIVNGEKGILNVIITFQENTGTFNPEFSFESEKNHGFIASRGKLVLPLNKEIYLEGKKAVSRHPERGISVAIPLINEIEKRDILDKIPERHSFSKMIAFIKETFFNNVKDSFKLNQQDKEMGESSVAITNISYKDGKSEVELDFRYTRTHTEKSLLYAINLISSRYNAQVNKIDSKPLLYIDKDSNLLKSLQSAYEEVTGSIMDPITKGGASYARVLDNGIAFGPTFPGEVPNSHLENEMMEIESLKRALKIYLIGLEKLVKNENVLT